MTVVIGMNCIDGFVLVTDSLESDGVTRNLADKIWAYQVDDKWGVSIAATGLGDLADSFTDDLSEILGSDSFDETRVLLTLRKAIAETRRIYPDSELGMLVGIYGPPFFRKIYRIHDRSMHLGPIRRYESLGIGSMLAKFLLSQMFSEFSLVDEAIRLGVFVVSRVCEHVEGCGGPISVIATKKGEKGWLYEHPEKILEIQAEFSASDFRKNSIDYWISKNPGIKQIEHDRYRPLSIGGFPRTHIRVSGSKKPSKQ